MRRESKGPHGRIENGPRGQPGEVLAPHTANDALLRWDELDEQLLRMLADDPERGWRLRKLQDADGWLRERASDSARKASGPALLVCPPPEDLYDFGQGPGASSLSSERRASIDRHLATCLECERFVGTLATVPPSPLIFGLPTEEDPLEEASPMAPVEMAPRRRSRLVPLLATAAAAVVLFLGVRAIVTPATMRFPEAPLLRGTAGGSVHYPRGRMLLPSAEVARLFPALSAPLRLEVEPQAEGEIYSFIYSRHEGGALGRDIQIDKMSRPSPTVVSSWVKEAGHFTLTAWVTKRGLDQSLGERDFRVVADPDIETNLLALSERSEIERTLAAVHLLHAKGYVSDARELARLLPPSRERDLYLDQVPGR